MLRQRKFLLGLRNSCNGIRCKTTSSHNDAGYQFMQRSTLPTMYFQQSLPRLPIPQLEKTCDRYLRALEPLLIQESMNKTRDVVNRFRTGSGPQLQKMLKDHDNANKHTNYISEPWFDMYLRDRVPLPINYNPLLIMKHDQRKEFNNQLIRSTNLVISSLRFMRSLRAGCLSPEVFHLDPKKSDTDQFRMVMKLMPRVYATYVAYIFKAYPLDMSQYNGLFGSTRIPELDKDRIYRTEKSKHIVVMRKGNFHAIDVLDESGNIEPPSVILSRIKRVLDDPTPAAEHPLGVFTAANRNEWANLRHHLVKLENEAQMKTVDSGLFCLCLDDDVVYDEHNPIPLVRSFLAGDATNRWFDKSFSILVAKDGTAAINFEHSWGDGVAVLRFFNETYDETISKPFVDASTQANDTENNAVRRIDFNIDDRIKQCVADVRKIHNDTMDSLNLSFIRYHDINKNFCKTNRVSPDAIMQLTFQLAFKQQFDKYVGTYESCSTAAFRQGRTETMRPCTVETKAFCDAVLSRNRPSNSELRGMIDECSKVHGGLTRDAAMGQGFDRHLFGLRFIAERNGIKKPSLYDDVAYQLINHNIISTSTLSSPGLLAGAFGPVVRDGLGIGYFIQNEESGCLVSSYNGQRDGQEYVNSLKTAFDTIRDILHVKN